MRYSKEHKQETHERIVRKASVRLREKGAHGVGVADLMKEAGLTHGGFYAHFASREALVIEAFNYAMDRSTERWRKLAEGTPPEKRFAAIVESYLTTIHRDDPGHGCAVPTLGPEIAREGAKARKAFCRAARRHDRDDGRPSAGTAAQGGAAAGDRGVVHHGRRAGALARGRHRRVLRRDSGERPRSCARSHGEEAARQAKLGQSAVSPRRVVLRSFAAAGQAVPAR